MSLKSERKSGTAKDPEGTRSRILDAALDVFSNKGYHEASVDEIVDRSSTSKGSVYFHFPNKQKLFLALVDKFADLLERRITEASEGEAIVSYIRVRSLGAPPATPDVSGEER